MSRLVVLNRISKLEQDELVEPDVVPQELLADRKAHSLTKTGRKELERWLDEDPEPQVRLRDELFLKELAQSVAGTSRAAADVIARQRQAYLQTLSRLTAMRAHRGAHPATTLPGG